MIYRYRRRYIDRSIYRPSSSGKPFGETEFCKMVAPCFAESRFAELGLRLGQGFELRLGLGFGKTGIAIQRNGKPNYNLDGPYSRHLTLT